MATPPLLGACGSCFSPDASQLGARALHSCQADTNPLLLTLTSSFLVPRASHITNPEYLPLIGCSLVTGFVLLDLCQTPFRMSPALAAPAASCSPAGAGTADSRPGCQGFLRRPDALGLNVPGLNSTHPNSASPRTHFLRHSGAAPCSSLTLPSRLRLPPLIKSTRPTCTNPAGLLPTWPVVPHSPLARTSFPLHPPPRNLHA